jgi:hypothetical protein
MLILPGTFCNGAKFSVAAAQFGVIFQEKFVVMPKKNLQIRFAPEIKGIEANTIGELAVSDIDDWSERLIDSINQNFPNQTFQLLINGNGYYPKSIQVHKTLNRFLYTNEIVSKQCSAVAFVHHDPKHVQELQPLVSDTQNFFLTYENAYNWLKTKQY